jgi:hypothetical protein
MGGLFLKTPKPPACGSAVELVIQVSPGTPGTDVRTRAVVDRETARGYGCEICTDARRGPHASESIFTRAL